MKLATFELDGAELIGVVFPQLDRILGLAHADHLIGEGQGPFGDMLALIDAGERGLDRARKLFEDAPDEAILPLSDVALLAPLPRPRRLRDSLVFEEHLINGNRVYEQRTGRKASIPDVWYRQPIYYKGNHLSVSGPEADILWPAYSEIMDYELELACITWKRGIDIAREDAVRHIFGLTIYNDCSARDAQMLEMPALLGPAKGKDFDRGNILGPWIVTMDEIGDVSTLVMEARVNGERWGGGSAGAMHHSFEDIVSFLSQGETIVAGEVIGSGTVGTGCGMEIGRYPQSGDTIELSVDRIGVLRNRFIKNPKGQPS